LHGWQGHGPESGELSAAERAIHIAERKRLYEEMHPETKHGATGGTNKGKSRSEVANFATSVTERFTADTAKKTGTSERKVQLDAARGEKIDAIKKVVGTSLDKGEELDALATFSAPLPAIGG
jgi:ParB family chromosome partitioning protein